MGIKKLRTNKAFAKILNGMFIAHLVLLDKNHIDSGFKGCKMEQKVLIKLGGLSNGADNKACFKASKDFWAWSFHMKGTPSSTDA